MTKINFETVNLVYRNNGGMNGVLVIPISVESPPMTNQRITVT